MLFKILRGDESRISLDVTPFHEGWAYVTHSGNYYVDMNIGTVEAPNNQRIKLNAANAETLCGISLEELKAQIASQDAVILSEAQAYTDNAIANIDIPDVDLTDYATKQYVDNAIANIDIPEIPKTTAADVGKFLRIDSNGNIVVESLLIGEDLSV